ncbi:MAG: hypothetical protein FD123_2036 [Bacteroidetes bacterium]|nr:MAG: hypothetical protein FD123_2036 [Bacteroidota bacterium]
MKTNSIKLLAAVFLVSMTAMTTAAQNSEDRPVGTFSGLQVAGGANVELKIGSAGGVRLEGPSEHFTNVKTEVKEGVLQVSAGGPAADKVKVIVTSPSYSTIMASGACNILSLDTLKGGELKLEASGASELHIKADVTKLGVSLSGASDAKLFGKAQQFDAVATGASDIKAYGLEADRAKVDASGSSDIRVNVKTAIDATATGSSDIRYMGNPAEKTLNPSGASSISVKSSEAANDTTRVGFGNKKYTIITDGDEDDDDDVSPRYDDDFDYWSGIDIHVNGLLNTSNSLEPDSAYDFMELNFARSIGFSANILQKNIHIYKNYVNLVTGIGLDWSIYSFRNNTTLRHDTDWVAATYDTVDYRRNRLRTMYVQAPIMLEFNTNKSADRSFHIGAGVLVGYNIFDNKVKQKYEEDGEDHKNVVKDDFNVNPLRYGLTARMGYGHYSVFANYNLSGFFEKDHGPTMYPVQAGVHIDF